MSQELNHKTIKQLLDHSSARIAPATLEKLRQARLRALDHQKVRHTAPVLAWLGRGGEQGDDHASARRMHWAAALLVLAFTFSAYAYWHHSTEHEISDIDIAILTDEDLPLHAYDADEE